MANSGAVLFIVLPLVGVGRAFVSGLSALSHWLAQDAYKLVLP